MDRYLSKRSITSIFTVAIFMAWSGVCYYMGYKRHGTVSPGISAISCVPNNDPLGLRDSKSTKSLKEKYGLE